jgi:uncharacterized protein YndB with AHSA1/START domain
MTEQTTDRMGTIERDGEQVVLRYQRRLAHPPERVWRALTDSGELRQWFPADIEGERRAGAELVFRFWPETREAVAAKGDEQAEQIVDENPALPGRLVVWDPPRRLELLWDTERVRYELTSAAGGTLLVLTVWPDGAVPAASVATGYHSCLDALTELLDTGAAVPAAARETGELEKEYAAQLG